MDIAVSRTTTPHEPGRPGGARRPPLHASLDGSHPQARPGPAEEVTEKRRCWLRRLGADAGADGVVVAAAPLPSTPIPRRAATAAPAAERDLQRHARGRVRCLRDRHPRTVEAL